MSYQLAHIVLYNPQRVQNNFLQKKNLQKSANLFMEKIEASIENILAFEVIMQRLKQHNLENCTFFNSLKHNIIVQHGIFAFRIPITRHLGVIKTQLTLVQKCIGFGKRNCNFSAVIR